MPKSADQKLKIIYLLHFLSENTDEAHPASMAELIAFLKSNGIGAERKSIYSDIEALNRIGYDILFRKEQPSGYYIGKRDFELAELKLLVDAVQSSKFITGKKSTKLIQKIEKLTSHHEAVKLQRQVYVANRVKTENESVFYNIDYLHEAISSDRRITFRYCEWNLKKELVYRNNRKIYQVDPVALIWEDENYYLVAYDGNLDEVRHYRVDKMRDIELLSERRGNSALVRQFCPADYVKEHFGMFHGTKETVRLQFEKSLVGVIIDRFGKDISIISQDETTATARASVSVSDQFFGWVAGFRGRILLTGPDSVCSQYKDFIDDLRMTAK